MISQLVSLDERAGTNVESCGTIDEVLQASGLNFEVETTPAHDPEGNALGNYNLIRRTDTNDVLGVVGKRYNVINNREMFEPFDSVVREHGAQFESAGVVKNGKICWISAKLPEDLVVKTKGGNDLYEQRVVMLTYHDGLRRNSYFTYNNRVICNNMLASLQAKGRKTLGVRHTPSWQAQLDAAQNAFATSVQDMFSFKQVAERLSSVEMSDNQAQMFATRFVSKWMDEDEKKKQDKSRSDRSKTIETTKVDNLLNYYTEGMGNEGKTRYDMLNAVTEYLDHRTTKDPNKNASNRLISNFTGQAANMKRLAVKELLREEGYLKLAA